MNVADDPITTVSEGLPDCDAFRTLEGIFTVDPRYAARAVLDPRTGARPMTIEDHWRDIDALSLHEGVPRAIRVHFDTARNLLLYSWFAYRLQQVAEMHAYASVEYALKHRAQLAPRARSNLNSLLAKAVRAGWIRDEGFRHYRQMAERRAEYEELEATLRGVEPETPPRARSYVQTLAKHLPDFRNKLAHGSAMLAPSGRRTLALCCDLINQLFPLPLSHVTNEDPRSR